MRSRPFHHPEHALAAAQVARRVCGAWCVMLGLWLLVVIAIGPSRTEPSWLHAAISVAFIGTLIAGVRAAWPGEDPHELEGYRYVVGIALCHVAGIGMLATLVYVLGIRETHGAFNLIAVMVGGCATLTVAIGLPIYLLFLGRTLQSRTLVILPSLALATPAVLVIDALGTGLPGSSGIALATVCGLCWPGSIIAAYFITGRHRLPPPVFAKAVRPRSQRPSREHS